MIRTAVAFVKKDFFVAVSYRFNMLAQVIVLCLFVSSCYFLGRFVDSGSIPLLTPYGGNYFAFLLIGIAFSHYMTVSVNSFAGSIREGQLTGTLEFILISPTRLSTFLIASSLSSYMFTSLFFLCYMLIGRLLFDLAVGDANLPAALLILALSIVCFAGVGILFAAVVLLVKKGDAVLNVAGGFGLVVSGLWFPPEVFPPWVAHLSVYIPMTYSLHGLRLAVLQGYSISSLLSDITALLVFSVLFIAASVVVFPLAVKWAKTKGTLIQY